MTDCKAETFVSSDHPALDALLIELATHLDQEAQLLQLSRTFTASADYPHAPHCYSRTILYRHDNGAEIMVARWDQGAITPIHGHPRYAFVYVLQGRLQIEHYACTDDGVQRQNTTIKTQGQHIYSVGEAGRYDNAIHRVCALSPSLSLHVYSDDALKGITF